MRKINRFMNRPIAASLIAMALTIGLSGAVFAAAPHGHDGHSAPTIELQLNNGHKWETDEALRTGMTQIRAALEVSLPLIHAERYSAAEFSALADRIQEQVDNVVANCKLPEEADLQLHVALAQILEGINAMKGPNGQEQGVMAIVQAVKAYGEHFDHPEEPLDDH
jgi:hypothetical protein